MARDRARARGARAVVAPWDWQGDLAPRLWAVLSGFGWAAGSVATKYFHRGASFDMLNFVAWQMLLGVLPLSLLPFVFPQPPTHWSVTQGCCWFTSAAISTAFGFLLWIEVLRSLPAGTASLNMFAIPVIALLMSVVVFGERLTPLEWIGIASIGAGLLIVTWRALRAARGDAQPMPDPTPADGG